MSLTFKDFIKLGKRNQDATHDAQVAAKKLLFKVKRTLSSSKEKEVGQNPNCLFNFRL
jgi:hypothetical protein